MPLYTTHKPTVRQKHPTNKSKIFCRRPSMRWGRGGKVSCLMHSGHTGQHTKPPSGYHPSNLFMAKHAICQWSWNIGPIGPSAMEHGFEASRKGPTNPTGRVGRMEGKILPQCQDLQGQNKMMARQEDQAERIQTWRQGIII